MLFTKFTLMLLKYHQEGRRLSMECTERKGVLKKNVNVDLQK